MSEFAEDVRRGLTSTPKRLSSKYFYDAAGDALFCEIMACPEYYLTDCEMEIFTTQSNAILDVALNGSPTVDVIELGPGDASKSIHLLRALARRTSDITYYPVDISTNIIATLEESLPKEIPDIKVTGRAGDFVRMVHDIATASDHPKLVLFLGSTIGNLTFEESRSFFSALRQGMRKHDMLLVGFDLQKDPQTILAAYNDAQGVTRRFNLNLLSRMNHELGAQFDLDTFSHYPMYDPELGTCKSFLVSSIQQSVRIDALAMDVHFDAHECIHTEVSQKYTLAQIHDFATVGGLRVCKNFYRLKGLVRRCSIPCLMQ